MDKKVTITDRLMIDVQEVLKKDRKHIEKFLLQTLRSNHFLRLEVEKLNVANTKIRIANLRR